MIQYASHHITKSDCTAVEKVLRSKFLTQGPLVEKFELATAKFCQARFGVATNSATSSLHTACLALGVGKGDVVWTSPNTFVASANCAIYCGAEIDFVDINSTSYNICVEKLEAKLKSTRNPKKIPKVVIVVHYAGNPCNMQGVYRLGQQYGFKIIEDASHALGASYIKKKVGCCEFSDITVFSFHPCKMITTGEGGMCVTNSKPIAEKLKLLRSHGIKQNTVDFNSLGSDETFYYYQDILGFNYRMSDIEAALGISQLRRIEYNVRKRTQLVSNYNRILKKLPIITPQVDIDAQSSWHLYVVRLEKYRSKIRQQDLIKQLALAGIQTNIHYIPVYRHPFYQRKGFPRNYCPEAENHFRNCLTLPLYVKLTKAQQLHITQVLTKIFDNYL